MNSKMDSEVESIFVLSQSTITKEGRMVLINPQCINDLISLHRLGIPVTLTSHPGNASLYKLSLWACGIPEHLWDITCAKADANNWPTHRLKDGAAELLLTEVQYQTIMEETSRERRYVTAYQKTQCGDRLGRVHTRPMQWLFPGVVSTQSHLLLKERARLYELSEYLAETRIDVFTRYISENGVMVPVAESGISRSKFASSFLSVLEELDHLLLRDEPLETRGGVCYEGVFVQLSGMLAHYWQTGEIVRCDISGPDMIHYTSGKAYRERLGALVEHIRRWKPELVPKQFLVHMFPGTVARVGYVCGHTSEEIMNRRTFIAKEGSRLTKEARRNLRDGAVHDETLWPSTIDPKARPYFSQHDLAALGKTLSVDPFWKDVPFLEMKEHLKQAQSFLRLS